MKTDFFEYLDFALQFSPAGPEEEAIRAKLATIGVGPGKQFSFKDLSPEHKAAILLGMKEGDKKVTKRTAQIGKSDQRLERRLGVRRPDVLQRRLAPARGGRPCRHLRQRRCRGDVSVHQDRSRTASELDGSSTTTR